MADLPTDWAARVRAARGYSGATSQKKFGEMLDVSEGTIKSYEKGGTPDRRAIPETIRLLVEASGLPEWFFTTARLDRLTGAANTPVEQRLGALEDSVGGVRAAVFALGLELGAAVGRLEALIRDERDHPGEEGATAPR